VPDERFMYETLGVDVPDPDSVVSASTDKVFSRILDSVNALGVSLFGMIGVR
jgi:hypothetical protein